MTARRYRPASGVAWSRVDRVEPSGAATPVVYLAHLPDGPIVVVEGPGAITWIEAIADDPLALASRVGRHYDVDAGAVEADVDAFIADLVERGLLSDVTDGPKESPDDPEPMTGDSP